MDIIKWTIQFFQLSELTPLFIVIGINMIIVFIATMMLQKNKGPNN